MTLLFEPFDLAGLALPNRIVMAPMTRSRTLNTVPDAQTALYYRQRAGAGLIISEGAPISVEARGFLYTPGLYTDAQVEGWREVTEAVHADGGRIFAQLWHVGRVSHASLQDEGAAPVGPTDAASDTTAFALDDDGVAGTVPTTRPRALETSEVARITADFVRAARRAIDAGFDGVELHGANGYLFEQFINGGVNTRTDRYGGSIENRLRFILETLDALAAEVGGKRVGVRISPFGRVSAMPAFADEAATWLALATALEARALAYVHLSDQLVMGGEEIPSDFGSDFRSAYRGPLIGAGGYDKVTGEQALQSGALDLIAMGRPFIANPDLVQRLENNWPLAQADRDTFYGATGARGYTDYPAYDAAGLRQTA
jgi:2,4-dienoyl-CoA reductase-like NADH-dependent reductase (Old Yellow Enzyme family)